MVQILGCLSASCVDPLNSNFLLSVYLGDGATSQVRLNVKAKNVVRM